uniref:Cation-transporting P-type ATPase N-terminal domain-containing protein n=1 Tax=Globisporangium ultimum (strain ATCC 200006 / CBS 805.95 / DAOM BR144) TaxID=431595 RepID=K3X7V9_GLOUD
MKIQALASLAVAALAPLHVAATASQFDYPACAVNHAPEYYCCDLGTADGASTPTKQLYTRYNRPDGADFGSYYEEGWKKSRQINWVPNGEKLSMYRPDSPSYVYGDPDNTCRLVATASKGSIKLKQECTFAPSSGDTRFTQNASLEDGTEGGKVFLTSTPNPRNNNAMFPIGATCEIAKTDEEKAKCSNAGVPGHYRYTSFKEPAFVFLYVTYGLCFGLLLIWAMVRFALSTSNKAGESGNLPVAVVVDDGSKKLLDNRGGPETPDITKSVNGPSLAMRATEVQLRHSVEDVEQVGHSTSYAGKFVLAYFVLMTVFLNIPVILVIRDNQGKYAGKDGFDSWFDPVNVIIKVFIVLWVVSAVWFALIVIYSDKLLNFFRIPTSLASCDRVTLFKPEKTEVLLADRSGVSQIVNKVEKFLFPNAREGFEATVPVFTAADGARYLEFQHLRYTYDDVEGKFIPGSVVLSDTYDGILADSQGLSAAEHTRRLDIVGRNAIEVEMPSIARSVVDEFFSFFYIYQLMCYYVWYFTNYNWVAGLNTVVIVVAASVNIYAKRGMFSSIVKMTHYQSEVTVKRDGTWVTVASSDIVPGDLVKVTENWIIPCDLVVVKGATVCDESMLTGESMPVQKFPVPNDSTDSYSAEGSGKKYTLFSGTKTLASGRDEEILAVVQSTGAHTSRGQLVQAILFPAPIKFKYDEHLKAVFSFLFLFGFVAAYLAMKFLMDNAGLSNTLFAFVYGMFMFSAVLNPLLPVVITIGQVNAAKRLQKQDVFCLNPQRITLCGKVRVFCFDKTGTITKEGLDFRGCVPVTSGATTEFLPEVNDMIAGSLPVLMKYSLASTHALGSLNGELVGNEVEVRMFKSTQWKLIESEGKLPVVRSADDQDQLEFVKRFEFDHHRMSMSVVMKHTVTGKLYVFCKGSYEKMQSVSKAESVPANYTETAENLAKDGCYVLGIAFKEIDSLADAELQAFLSSRDAVEEGLSLLGLIMFRNELKEDSRDALLTLKKGDIRSVMITGDNAMTGCFIARASGMVDADSNVVLGDMVMDSETGASLVWKDVDSQVVYSSEQIHDLVKFNSSVELAVTGKAFDYLVKMGEIESLLLNIRIFSRMTPAGKVECVKLHMAAGAVTGMCGDGGNDCGALRIAHVGVALSDAEASVVSPFTSKTRSLQSIVDLVREGRGALATSFGSVKYLIMYGLIGIGCRFVMYYNGVFISQFGFMYLDGAILVGLSYSITRCRPQKVLGSERPTSSLVGPTTLFSLVGAWVIHELFLFGGIKYVMGQVWYCPFSPANVNLVHWWELQDSNLGSSLWFLVCWQQMVTGITMSLGSKFRRPVWRNYFLMFYYVLLFVVLCILFLGPPTRFTDQFRVASSTNVVTLPDIPLPVSFRWELFGIGMANTVTAILYEYLIVLGPVRNYFRAKYHKDVLPLKL